VNATRTGTVYSQPVPVRRLNRMDGTWYANLVRQPVTQAARTLPAKCFIALIALAQFIPVLVLPALDAIAQVLERTENPFFVRWVYHARSFAAWPSRTNGAVVPSSIAREMCVSSGFVVEMRLEDATWTVNDPRQFAMACAQLDALRKNIPSSLDEPRVNEYHAIIDALELASGENFSQFRIPDSEIKPKLLQVRARGWDGSPGSAKYSDKKYCERNFFTRQIEALWLYLEALKSIR
jgi:hypothetical protein